MWTSVRLTSFAHYSIDGLNPRPNTGANPSTEDVEEALEEGAKQVNNVVHSFRLQPTSFDKKSYLTYLKVRLHIFPRH